MKDEFKIEELATKKDFELLQIATKKDLELLQITTKKDIEGVEAKLQKEIIHSRNQIIVWIVGFLMANGIVQHWL